jgi:hypothetical protein
MTPFNGRTSSHTFNVVDVAPGDDGEAFARGRGWAMGLYAAL